MSDEIQKILKQIDRMETTINRQIKMAYETDPHIELTPIVLPTEFTQLELNKYCSKYDFSEIRYNARTRQFFGVRIIEEQLDYPPMG